MQNYKAASFFILLLAIPLAYAATVSHDASQIFGSFSTNVTFSQNVNVAGNINISGIYYGDGSGLTGISAGTASKSGDGIYLYNDSIIIYFNESKLNATIDARSINTSNATYWNLTGFMLYLLDSDYSVGLGTDSPSNKLTVIGDINATSNISTPMLCLNGICQISWPTSSAGKSGDGIYLYNDSIIIYFNESKLNATIDARSINTSNATYWNISGSNLYPLSLAYNVGIGTDSPTQKLHVEGNVNITGTAYVKNFSGNPDITFVNSTLGQTVTISENGSVGIGTPSPGQKLDILGGGIRIRNQAVDSGGLITAPGNRIAFTVNSQERMRVDYNGRIGINTESPVNTLDVNGTINITDPSGTLITPELCLNNDCQTSWPNGADGSNATYWNISGLNLYPLSLAYNVGIGTTNADEMLVLRRTTDDPILKISSGGNIGPNPAINLTANADSFNGIVTYDTNAADLILRNEYKGIGGFIRIQTNGSNDRLIITDAGNVGINSASPDAALEVNGSFFLNGFQVIHAVQPRIEFNETDAIANNQLWRVIAEDNYFSFQAINDSGSGGGNLFILERVDQELSGLEFGTFNSPLFSANITTGKIGINTQNPTVNLHVEGNANVSAGMYANYFFADNGSFVVRTNESARVALIDIQHGGAEASPVWSIDNNNDNLRIFREQNSTSIGTTAIVIRNNTYVAIGPNATSPTQQLHVEGEANITTKVHTPEICLNGTCKGDWDMQLWNESEDNIYPSSLDYWVVIGATFPTQPLHVEGEANVTTKLHTPELCLNGDCQSSWPSGADGSNATYWNVSSNNIYPLSLDHNVGIGTSSTTQKLHVEGNANITGTLYVSNVSSNSPLQLQTAGTTRIFVNDSTGFVGINNTNPQKALDIMGDLNVSGTLYGDGSGLTGVNPGGTFSCVTYTASPGIASGTASCSTGIITGGGAACSGSFSVGASYPSGNGWYAACAGGTTTIYARCCTYS